MAPEVYALQFQEGDYDSKKADIWSLGITLSKLILPSAFERIGDWRHPPDAEAVASMRLALQQSSEPENFEVKVRIKGKWVSV